MWPDRVSNPGPLTYESGALPIALRSPARPTLNGTLYDGRNLQRDWNFSRSRLVTRVSVSVYRRTSMARTLMARLPRLFRTRS